MSNLHIDRSATSGATRRASERPHIPLPNGDFLEPRRQWAAAIGISDRTAGRMNLPTTYVGNVAYVPHNASLKVLADRVKHRNEPPPRGRRAR
jgi:hypothetical protein